MSQRETLQRLDASIVASFMAGGLADAALYLAADALPDTEPTPCHVFIDRHVQAFGEDFAQVATHQIVATLFLSQVPAPVRGSLLTIGAESFQLDAQLKRDESRSVWVLSDA